MPFAGGNGSFYENLVGSGLTGFDKRRQFRKASKRLFGELGFAPKDRRAFRQAVASGDTNSFFIDRPTAAKLFEDIINFNPENLSGSGRQQKRATSAIDLARQLGSIGGFDYGAIPASPGEPDYTNEGPEGINPPGSGRITPTPYATGGSIEDLINKYGGGLGTAGRALAEGASGPAFEDMFNTLRALADEEANRQSARLNEAFGSRGARYGSDILGAQSNLRRQTGLDISALGNQLLRDLRGDRTAELTAAGGLENQARQSALNRLFQDFLIQSAPPPLFAPGANFTGGYSPGDSVTYFQ